MKYSATFIRQYKGVYASQFYSEQLSFDKNKREWFSCEIRYRTDTGLWRVEVRDMQDGIVWANSYSTLKRCKSSVLLCCLPIEWQPSN